MSVECDVRNRICDKLTPQRVERAQDLQEAARERGGHPNPFTGTPAVLWVSEVRSHGEVETALATMTAAVGTGLDFFPDTEVRRTSAGARIVHLHQQYRGIPVYEAVRSVHFGPDSDEVRCIVGDHVEVRGEIDVAPTQAAAPAVLRAAEYLADGGVGATPDGERLEVSPDLPRVLSSSALANRPTVLAKEPFAASINAHLVLLYRGEEEGTDLGWLVTLALPGEAEEYDLIVAANGEAAGEILYCQSAYYAVEGRGPVYRFDPGEDEEPEEIDLPLARGDYPSFLGGPPAPSFGRLWIRDDATFGNNAVTLLGNKRNSQLRGQRQGATVVFSPNDKTGQEQQLLNAFYFCNFMHDFFALLGFGEAQGNFQRENFGGVVGDDDELEVRVYHKPGQHLGLMRSRRDGKNGEMFLRPNKLADGHLRHAALDADVVFHEYAHGVTNRIVGGRLVFEPFRRPESLALAEGYSDYFALTIQSWYLEQEKTALGAWVTKTPDGLRSYKDPLPTYEDLLDPDFRKNSHNAGRVWCAALMNVNRELGLAFEDPRRGHEIGWQLVVDSLDFLTPGPDKPGFLDARDAVVDALGDYEEKLTLDERPLAWSALHTAFARAGMGPRAQGGGARFRGIAADSDLSSDAREPE